MKRLLTLLTGILFLASCNDSSDGLMSSGQARMQVALVDDPAAYEAVLIDVEGLEYKIEAEESDDDEGEEAENDDSDEMDDDNTEWATIDIEPRVYDILELNNGDEALLADLNVDAGELKEIRLKLGSDNQVVIDGDTLDLMVPSGSTSGLKLKVEEDLEAGESYKLTMDFDAALSITETGNGKFILRPVIRVSLEELDADDYGSISGVVSPDSVSSVVYVIEPDNEDTVSTMPEADGTFLIDMLSPDSYNVIAVPNEESGLNAASTEGIVVVAGEEQALDTLRFTE